MTREPTGSFSLNLADFASLGAYAEAGVRSTTLALERAARSFAEGRIPIAGAAVLRSDDETLTTVTVGHNCRIPPSAEGRFGYPAGYPSDHGETSAIRRVGDITKWDWSRVVFTTTLSPCIMCTRTLTHLHGLGLNKIVIAEAETFPGTKDQLAALPGMTLVELTNPDGVRMMRNFARTYPWDWAADIGEVPPGRVELVAGLAASADARHGMLVQVREALGNKPGAALMDGGGALVASALDERAGQGGNPTFSGTLMALGRAGSTINLRESVVVLLSGGSSPVDIDSFGLSSLGACELFRPAAVLTDAPFDEALTAALTAAGVRVLVAA